MIFVQNPLKWGSTTQISSIFHCIYQVPAPMAEKVLKSAFLVEFHDFPQKCIKYTKVALKHVFGGAGEVATEWLPTFLQLDHDLGH